MVVSSTTSKKQYNGDGATALWPVPFQFLDPSDIIITVLGVDGVTETTRILYSQYTVAGGNGSTGSITFLGTSNIPKSGEKFTISRNVQLTQNLDLTPNDPLPANSLERGFGDRLVMMIQHVAETNSRTAKLLISSALTNAPSILDPVPGCLLAYDATGTEIVAGPPVSAFTNITGYVTQASAAATAAQSSAALAAGYAAALTSVSSTSLAIETGSKVFVTDLNKQYATAMFVTAVSMSNTANYMHGNVTSYNPSTGNLTVLVADIGGSGTANDWAIAVSGTRGAAGAAGPTGMGSGDVSGPSSSVDSEVALFSSTTGKMIKRATGTGFAKVTNGVLSAQSKIALTDLATQAANTFLANGTNAAAAPTAIALGAASLAGRGQSGNVTAITLGSFLSMAGNVLDVAPPAASYNATNGSYPLPGGLIIKWVYDTSGTNNATPQSIYFATPFPNQCFGAVAPPIGAGIAGGDTTYDVVTGWDNNGVYFAITTARFVIAIGR